MLLIVLNTLAKRKPVHLPPLGMSLSLPLGSLQVAALNNPMGTIKLAARPLTCF
jgi:hypothetical protein